MILDVNDIETEFLLELAVQDYDSFDYWFGEQEPFTFVTAQRGGDGYSLFRYKDQGYIKYRDGGIVSGTPYVLTRYGWPYNVEPRTEEELRNGSFYFITLITGGEKIIFE